MESLYSIYCAESYIFNDHQTIMVVGALWFGDYSAATISQELFALKSKHGFKGRFSWPDIVTKYLGVYLDLIEYFFSKIQLHYRSVIVDQRIHLSQDYFNQDLSESMYYKVMLAMFKPLFNQDNSFNVYLDLKNNRSRNKTANFKEIIARDSFERNPTGQPLNSISELTANDSVFLEIADFFNSAVSHSCLQDPDQGSAKAQIVQYLEKKIKRKLFSNTSLYERKFSNFVFSPSVSD